jgi:hypothetical protein
MWRVMVLVMLLGITRTSAAADFPTWIMPSPMSVLLQLGKWVMRDKDEVFEVTVRGIAADPAQAREQGFRLAVQEAVGSLMLSRTEVESGQVRRNEILNYSSGYVDRFEILRQDRDLQGTYSIDMRVWVRRSALADGLFAGQANTNSLDASRAQAGVLTLRQQRTSSDDMLRAVLDQWPESSFKASIKSSGWQLDDLGRSVFVVEIRLDWNEAWLRSVGEVITKTSAVPDSHPCRVELVCHRGQGLYYVAVRWRNGYWGAKDVGAWPERSKLTVIQQTLGQEAAIRLEFLDSVSRVVRRQCISPQQMQAAHVIDNAFNLVIYSQFGVELLGYGIQQGRVYVTDLEPNALLDSNRIRARVVRRHAC